MNLENDRTIRLVIAAGDDPATVLNRVLDDHHWIRSPSVTLALADRALLELPGAPGPLVAAALKHRGISTRIAAPPATTVGSWFRARRTEWRAIELSAPAGRLERVWLPASIVALSPLVAINTLPPSNEGQKPIAIGIWAKFAHPRQRTGAWLSNDRDGLGAEIASAVHPALILIFTTWRGLSLVIASDDQVAAELAGRSVQHLTGDPHAETVGPWEHPLVQHAAELNVGIQHSAQLSPEVNWCGTGTDSEFAEFASAVLARIGLKSS